MTKKLGEYIPGGPLTTTSLVFGWLFMFIGIYLSFSPFLPPQFFLATTREFLGDVPIQAVCLYYIVSGFFLAKPGCAYRRLKAYAAAFSCMLWVGTFVWPLFTGSGNPVSMIGVVLWLGIAVLIVDDSYSATYADNHCHKA